jgi:hypothetical protein
VMVSAFCGTCRPTMMVMLPGWALISAAPLQGQSKLHWLGSHSPVSGPYSRWL